MPESGFHAPGTENDPRAPWNEPEPVDCYHCDGTGLVNIETGDSAPEDARNDPYVEDCDVCKGRGTIDPRDIEED